VCRVSDTDRLVARWDLEADTANVAVARHRTAQLLTEWGCDGLVADAELVVTELVTNAIVHAETSCRVSIEHTGRGVRIAVADGDIANRPRPQPFDLEREGGRGLLIVSTLAAAWGIAPGTTGKTVWADLVS
jgi:anti-sigma regulatory factor (Ser/Thr protein kinase)